MTDRQRVSTAAEKWRRWRKPSYPLQRETRFICVIRVDLISPDTHPQWIGTASFSFVCTRIKVVISIVLITILPKLTQLLFQLFSFSLKNNFNRSGPWWIPKILGKNKRKVFAFSSSPAHLLWNKPTTNLSPYVLPLPHSRIFMIVPGKKNTERKASNEFTFLYVMLTTTNQKRKNEKKKTKTREWLMIYTVISTNIRSRSIDNVILTAGREILNHLIFHSNNTVHQLDDKPQN